MYIHRIVIDANLINARGRISAMNALETLDEVGLVEVFQTSTLAADFRQGSAYSQGQQKARRYATLGSSAMVYLTNTDVADSQSGASGRESRFMEVHRALFGDPASDEMLRANQMRDALHVDQAAQHGADFFVTADGDILAAAEALSAMGIRSCVCTADDCLAAVTNYFSTHYGTGDVGTLSELLSGVGPVVLGSNSCGDITCVDVETGEPLLGFRYENSTVEVRASIRGADGERVATIAPGRPVVFEKPGPSIVMEVGPAALLIGDKHCRSFAVTLADGVALAGRVLRSGRTLVHEARFHAASGQLALQVRREVLELHGVNVLEGRAP